MSTWKPWNWVSILAVALLLAPFAASQARADDVTPQQMLMAKRAAQLDAYRQLAERIFGLQIKADTYVRDFVTESDRIRTAMEEFIKGVRFTETRYFDDGSAEVDAEVTLQEVIQRLKSSAREFHDGTKWTQEMFEEIERTTQTKVLAVTGAGAARVESAIPDPADVNITDEVVTPNWGRRVRVELPPIYSKYPPNERLKARRAAELDAMRLLLERIYGLQIKSDTFVRDFITESDQIRTSTEGFLKGQRVSAIRYAPDGVVEVEMKITIEDVIRTVKRVCDEVYKGDRWTVESFEEIKTRTDRKVLTVIGTGALDVSAGQRSSTSSSTTIRTIDLTRSGPVVD